MIDAFKAIFLSQPAAVVDALDVPSQHRLVVDIVQRYPRDMSTSYYDWAVREAEEMPARMVVSGHTGDGSSRWHVGIDLEKQVIASANWNILFSIPYLGSAALGIALLGLPSLLLTSPLLLLTHGAYRVHRLATGMDRHVWTAYRKIAPQLMTEDRPDFKQAFKNHCNGVEECYNEELRRIYDEKVRSERAAKQFANRKDDICDGAFMVRFAAGCAEPEEALDDVTDWYRRQGADRNVQLHEWLGMTQNEFESWKRQEKTVVQLLEERSKSNG